ncbi:hypothetical protein ACS0TY_000552 [Phlomoides rotata]
MLVSWRSVLNYPFAFDVTFNLDRKVEIVGSCNGLVCILEDTGGLILCNPSTRMAMNLPDIGVGENLVGKAFTKYGFGYDESSDDYKVFVVITLCCSPNVYRAISRLYSLKTNSWKTLKDEQDSDIQFGGGGTFASGNLHWVTGNREIGSFNLKSEVDGMVEQPSYPKGDIFPTLGVIDGCLSVISVLCFKDYQHAYFDVWVMKEYGVKESWVKVVTLPNFRRRIYSICERLVSFSRGPKGEILVIHSSTFVVYYPKGNGVHHRSQINNTTSVTGAYFYVESLVSVASNAEQEPKHCSSLKYQNEMFE